MERQKRRRGQGEERSIADRKQCEGMRKLQGGTGENYTETQVERWRREGKEPPNPAPPCPSQPCSSNPRLHQLNSPCGKQVRLGWVIWVWKHNVARHKNITHTVGSAGQHHTDGNEGGSGVDGLWFTDGSALSLRKAATGFLYITPVQNFWTPNVVYLPRIHMQHVQTHTCNTKRKSIL